MITQSCQNCWFNGLQYGALGCAYGYCARHRKILNASITTTCRYHLRKDLSLNRVQEVKQIHEREYPTENIVRLMDRQPVNGEVTDRDKDIERLRSDEVAEPVIDYGTLGSKIESLARLRQIPSARAELAMLSLARGYVQNCVRRDGDWKSGIHLYWWTKSRLSKEPEINLEEIDLTGGLAPERQVLLTTWSIIMLRLTFIEDIAVYAHDHRDPLGEAIGLLDAASEKVNTFNPSRLLGWIKKEAQPYLDRLLDRERYTDLSNRLHVEDEAKTHESR